MRELHDKFDYATKFPLSRNLARLGLKKCSMPVTSLVDFGQDLIEERRASGKITDATAYDYRHIFEARVLRSDLGPNHWTRFTTVTSTR